jgi:hypothetical protein
MVSLLKPLKEANKPEGKNDSHTVIIAKISYNVKWLGWSGDWVVCFWGLPGLVFLACIFAHIRLVFLKNPDIKFP